MSQIYRDGAEAEKLLNTMFDQIAESDPDGMDPLTDKHMVIRFRLSEPDLDMWVDGRQKPVRTAFEALDTKPTLTADLTVDTLHELLLGTLPLGKGLSSRRLKVKGSKLKALKLESLLHACQAVYPGLVEAMSDET